MHARTTLAALAGAALSAAAASAGLPNAFSSMNMIWDGEFQQTGPASLSIVDYEFRTQLQKDPASPATLLGIDLSWADASGGGSTVALAEAPLAWQYKDDGYASRADLEAAYPPGGVYTFDADVDGAGVVSDGLAGAGALWAANDPLVNNYAALQSLDPGQDFVVSFDGFTAIPGASYAANFVSIYDPSTGNVLSAVLDPSETSWTVPAGTLAPGGVYEFTLEYQNRIYETLSGPFDGAVAVWMAQQRTVVDFTTVPTPGAAVLGGLALAGAVRRRRR